MVHNLCKHYGTVAGKLDLASGPQTFYNFPAVSALAGPGVEAELRDLGFGYRAKYIAQTAQYLVNNHEDGEKWLHSLRDLPYEEAHEELLKLSGVGPKVADCICLMSLDQHAAIPVDTHVYQIAHRDYGFKLLKSKTLTKKAYTDIGELFRKLWGPKAGWAHSVLFTADLKSFQERLSPVKKEESADIIPSSPTPVTVTNGIENVKVEEFPMSPLSSVPSDNEVSKDSSVEDGVSGKGNGVAGDVTVKMEAVEQTNGNRVLKKRKFRKEVVIEESKKSKIN
ncbi:DNA glycosylase [Paraphysoderma sedebokerense]|nr:DNA glycosylase [Paraphysoderma sedebokerense]